MADQPHSGGIGNDRWPCTRNECCGGDGVSTFARRPPGDYGITDQPADGAMRRPGSELLLSSQDPSGPTPSHGTLRDRLGSAEVPKNRPTLAPRRVSDSEGP